MSVPCWTKASDDGKTPAAAPKLEYYGVKAMENLEDLFK